MTKRLSSVVAALALAFSLATVVGGCGQKGPLIAVPPVKAAASAPSTAPLPPPEPLTPASPGTAPR